MATPADQRAKLEEWEAAAAAYHEKAAQSDADLATAAAANETASLSMAAKLASLQDWHQVDNELDALVQEVEPPAIPE